MSQWSVGVIHHLTGDNGRGIEVPQASYGIDHSALSGAVRDIHLAAQPQHIQSIMRNNPNADLDRRAFEPNSVPQTDIHGNLRRDRNGGQLSPGHREIRLHTPEGLRVHSDHVTALMNGRMTADEVRSRTSADHDAAQQSAFENKIRVHMANHGSLPHSGVDAMVLGLPTASSHLGQAIHAGFEKRSGGMYQRSGFVFPRWNSSGPVPDRASHPGRRIF